MVAEVGHMKRSKTWAFVLKVIAFLGGIQSSLQPL